MKWLTETIITLTPLSLAILLFAAMCAGWVIYGLRGYKYWWRRFHHYRSVPSRKRMKKNYGYVEYIPEVTNQVIPVQAQPKKRPAQIIHKNTKTQTAPVNLPVNETTISHKDDLQVIEGIGPKIESILNASGIKTWKQLAKTSARDIKTILGQAGKRFQMHDPQTWPKQAHMADSAQWDELKKYQDYLHGGRG